MTHPPKSKGTSARRLLATSAMRRGALHTLPRTRGPHPGAPAVAKAAGKAAAASYKKFKRSHNELEAAWPEIVGTTLAHLTRPEHYQPGTGLAHNGILTIRVAGAIALDLQHMEPQIVERVNAYFGYQAIARLKIVQGPVTNWGRKPALRPRPLGPEERRRLEETVAPVDDEALRVALMRLGVKIMTRKETP